MKKIFTGFVSITMVAGILTLAMPTPAQAGSHCIIRCSDLHGCQTCCQQKGGWVCN